MENKFYDRKESSLTKDDQVRSKFFKNLLRSLITLKNVIQKVYKTMLFETIQKGRFEKKSQF